MAAGQRQGASRRSANCRSGERLAACRQVAERARACAEHRRGQPITPPAAATRRPVSSCIEYQPRITRALIAPAEYQNQHQPDSRAHHSRSALVHCICSPSRSRSPAKATKRHAPADKPEQNRHAVIAKIGACLSAAAGMADQRIEQESGGEPEHRMPRNSEPRPGGGYWRGRRTPQTSSRRAGSARTTQAEQHQFKG